MEPGRDTGEKAEEFMVIFDQARQQSELVSEVECKMTISEEQRREAANRLEKEIQLLRNQIDTVADLKERRRLKRQLEGKRNLQRRLLGKFR